MLAGGPSRAYPALRTTSVDKSVFRESAATKKTQVIIQNEHYALVRVQINLAQSILDQINANLQPNPSNKERPNSIDVKDWELGEAKLVKVDELENYLGVFQEPSARAKAQVLSVLRSKRPWSQLIDWYAAMAKALSEAN
jgi:hypothetical protein